MSDKGLGIVFCTEYGSRKVQKISDGCNRNHHTPARNETSNHQQPPPPKKKNTPATDPLADSVAWQRTLAYVLNISRKTSLFNEKIHVLKLRLHRVCFYQIVSKSHLAYTAAW